jgi:hypothetical protein
MRATRDDDDYVLGNAADSAELAAGDTSLDVMTCAIGQLSDPEIMTLSGQELRDLLSLSRGQPVVPRVIALNDENDLATLRPILLAERDRCQRECGR